MIKCKTINLTGTPKPKCSSISIHNKRQTLTTPAKVIFANNQTKADKPTLKWLYDQGYYSHYQANL